MVEQVDERLGKWITSILQGVEVSLGPPSEAKPGRRVGVYLLEMIQCPPPSAANRPPLQLDLRYLVTAWSDTPEDAHSMLGDLALAAMDNSEFPMELEPVAMNVWMAFGMPPRPSFVLRLPLRKERKQVDVKPVLYPMVVQYAPTVSFFGSLVGRPGDVPLVDVAVEVPSLRLLTRSDRKGRFSFATVPSQMPLDFRIRAKGKEFRLKIEGSHPLVDDPLVIPLDVLEG